MKFPRVFSGRRVSNFIKSVQNGTITMPQSVTSTTVTIAAVDMNNTLLFQTGRRYSDNAGVPYFADAGHSELYLVLTNSVTVTLKTGGGTFVGANAWIYDYSVIEFWPGVWSSIQRGESAITGNVNSVTVTLDHPVNPKRAILMSLGMTSAQVSTEEIRRTIIDVTLTDQKTLTVARTMNNDGNAPTYVSTISWQLADP